MEDRVMIEIIHNLPPDKSSELRENISTYKPRELANILAHLRGGLTAGIAAM
jgi:hypothetical protein